MSRHRGASNATSPEADGVDSAATHDHRLVIREEVEQVLTVFWRS